jgi:outer membrane protein assembly factor BamA
VKYNRLIGLYWLLLSLTSGSYSQNMINLDIRIRESSGDSGSEMFKKLRISDPLRLTISDLNPKIEKIIGFYENSGYPFVQISLDSVNALPAGTSGILLINPGQLVTIDTLLNRTGFRLSSAILKRLINIRPGDRYSESHVFEASKRLGLIPWLSQARPLEIGFHPGKASVYVYPEKASANRFDGWVGLSPDLRAGGKLAFSGALTLNLYNSLGQGENWQFDWHRNQDRSQQLNLLAHIPYMAGLPFGLQGKFQLYRQDTSYLNLRWDIGIPYHFNPNHLINLFIRHRESTLLVPVNDFQNTSRQPLTSLLSGLTWEFIRLDNRMNPYRGIEFRLEAATGRKSIPDSISMQQSEFTADISWYQPLAKSLTCAFLLQSGYRRSPETYDNEQYRLGGLALLRGFDENVFHTDAFAVASVELRYLLDQTSHLIVLADVGFLKSLDKNIPIVNIPVGIGLGGQIRTSGGIFRIILAMGKQADQPINIKNSKIHLGYVGVF